MNRAFASFVALFVFVLVGAGVRAQTAPCSGLPLAELLIEGCEGLACEKDEERVRLGALANLQPGRIWSADDQKRAVARLLETRFFHTVRAACTAVDGEAHVALYVEGNWVVRKVDIDGNQFFYKSDILKRVFLRPGSVLDAREDISKAELERQAASIERLYAAEGFTEASVTVTPVDVQGAEITLSIDIKEGDKDRIGGLDVTFVREKTEDEQSGCPPVSARDVRKASDLGRGDVFTKPARKKAQQRILQMLRRRGYVRPRVAVSPPDKRRRVAIKVNVDRCYDIRFFVREEESQGREAFRESTNEDFAKALPFAESGAFDEQEAELGRQELEALLESQGRLFSDVRLHYRDFGIDETHEGHPEDVVGAVHYYVTKDSVTEIRGIFLHGAEAFPDDTVREWMETEIYDFFGTGGYVQVQRLLYDLVSIRNHYRDAGHPRFRFAPNPMPADDAASPWKAWGEISAGDVPPSATLRRLHEKGDWVIADYWHNELFFTVVRQRGEGTVYLHVWFQEGQQSRLKAVMIEGNEELSDKAVRKELGLASGSPFSPSRVSEAVSRLEHHYDARGYYSTSVDVSCVPDETDSPCSLDAILDAEVSVAVRIQEGRRRVIGERFVRGNFLTKQSVVLDELPKAGEPYDQRRIQEGIRRLRDLGVFQTLRVNPVGLEEDPPSERIGLVVDMEEAPAKFLDLSVGFETLNRDEQSMPDFLAHTLSDLIGGSDQRETGYGEPALLRIPDLLFVVEASFLHRNFLGLGKELHIPLKYGLSTTELNRLASFRPTYIDKRPFGLDFRVRLTPFIEYDRATQTLDQFQYGAELEFSRQFGNSIYTSLEYELSRIQVRDPRDVGADFGPFTLQNKLSPRVSWDRTDSPLNPTKGLTLSASLSYINALQESTFDNFLRYEVSARFYISLRRILTLAVYARFGSSYSFDADDLPETERFRLGGNQGMRGFADDGVGQYDSSGKLLVDRGVTSDGQAVPVPLTIGGDTIINGTVELRFPILRRIDLWGAAFLDWGALSEGPEDLNRGSFRVSAGFGVRWLVGGQVPVRVDYGMVIDPRCKAYTADWQCVQEDFGALHFGMLYTF